MNKIYLFLLLLSSGFQIKAQFKKIAEGPEFDEPKSGYTQIIQKKNGGTFFLRITLKEGIDIRIYDAKHKEKIATTIDPDYEKLPREANIIKAFEVNNDIVILISTYDDKKPVLKRLVIDGNNGRIKKQDDVRELMKITMGQGYAMMFAKNMKMPGFYATRSPSQNCYAVTAFNTFESDRNKRIEIIVFGADHKEINRAFYTSPEEKYKYLDYLDMEVLDDGRVSLLVNAYNTRAHGGKASEIILGDLEKGSKSINFSDLGFNKDSVAHVGVVKYNPHTKKTILVASIKEKENSRYVYNYVSIVDPVTHKSEKTFSADLSDDVYGKSYQMFKKKDNFSGVLREVYINDDGGFTIAYEEEAIISSSSGNNTHIELNNIAVSVHNNAGDVQQSFLIPKSNWIEWHMYYSPDYGFGNQYKRFTYINGGGNNYLMLNDTERNIDRIIKNREPIKTIGISQCDAFYFPLTGKDLIPSRVYLFGAPESNKEHNLAAFGVADYDKTNNIFVTLKAMPSGRDKLAKIVWFTP